MLNRKRIAAVITAAALTVTVQSVAGLYLPQDDAYQSSILTDVLEMNMTKANAAETDEKKMESPEEATDGDDALVMDDDPGRERLSGQAGSPDMEEGLDAFMYARSIPDYSPFMGNTPYFHSDVFAGRNIAHGIDVSKYQQDIDWQKVAKAGVEFAIIRVGYRGYGAAGGMGADTYFDKNVKGAIAAGIDVGVYFFSQATTKAEAIEEAKYTLDKIKGYDITLPVVMDFEYATVNGKEGGRLYDANLSKTAATNVCLAFCETVEKAGYEPMVYANASMLKNKMNASDISSRYKIWLANYTSMTSYTGTYDFWQYSSKGSVNGITGNVDCNFWYQEVGDGSAGASGAASPTVKGFSVGGRTQSRIRLNWTRAANVDGYRIYRYDEAAKSYKKVKTIQDGNAGTWVDTGLEAGKTYQYVIKSYIKDEDGTHWGAKTEPVVAKTRAAAVKGFALTVARKDKIRLSWKQAAGADGYRIYRYNPSTKTYEKIKTIGSGSTATWVNSELKSNTTYRYMIKTYIEAADGTRYGGKDSDVVIAKTS